MLALSTNAQASCSSYSDVAVGATVSGLISKINFPESVTISGSGSMCSGETLVYFEESSLGSCKRLRVFNYVSSRNVNGASSFYSCDSANALIATLKQAFFTSTSVEARVMDIGSFNSVLLHLELLK